MPATCGSCAGEWFELRTVSVDDDGAIVEIFGDGPLCTSCGEPFVPRRDRFTLLKFPDQDNSA